MSHVARALAGLAALLLLSLPATADDARDPVRVATLVPAVEEALAGLPGVEVVAGVRRSFHEPERTDVVDLGNAHRPSLERLAAANAELVVGDALLHTAERESLARFGADVVLLELTSVEGTFAGLLALGRRVGAEEALRERVDAARAALEGLALAEPVSVLALFGTPGSFLVTTGSTWLGSLLAELGFENVGDFEAGPTERAPGYVDVSHEQLAVLRPQLILLAAHGDPRRIQQVFEQRVSETGAWHGLRAGATHGVKVLDPRLFALNPGLRLPEAARALVGMLGSAGSGSSVDETRPVAARPPEHVE